VGKCRQENTLGQVIVAADTHMQDSCMRDTFEDKND